MVEIEEVGGILSIFLSRIEDSEIKQLIDIIDTRIVDANELNDLTSHEQDTIYRVQEIFDIVKNRLFSIDPYLVSKKVLDNIISNTKTIESQLHLFIQNHPNNTNAKIENITRINDFLDAVITNVTQIFHPAGPSDVEALKESIVSTRSSLSQHNRYIKEEYEEFHEEKQRLENEISDLYAQLNGAEEKISNLLETGQTILGDFERMFSEKQQERTESFSELQSEWKESLNVELREIESVFKSKLIELERESTSFKRQLESRMEEYIGDIQLAKDELYKLIEVAGNDVMSDGYAKYANKAATRRLWWQVGSVLSLLGVILSTIFIIVPSIQGQDFSWSVLVSRALITLSAGALSGFTIRQSQLAYNEEQRNREMQLKLGSIEPYLKNFEQEKRNQIKEQLVTDYFSRHSAGPSDNQQPINQTGNSQTQVEQPTA